VKGGSNKFLTERDPFGFLHVVSSSPDIFLFFAIFLFFFALRASTKAAHRVIRSGPCPLVRLRATLVLSSSVSHSCYCTHLFTPPPTFSVLGVVFNENSDRRCCYCGYYYYYCSCFCCYYSAQPAPPGSTRLSGDLSFRSLCFFLLLYLLSANFVTSNYIE
jgi:hypothetical protein